MREYVHGHLYVNGFAGWQQPPGIGMIVAGFSTGGQHAQEFQIEMDGTGCAEPALLRQGADCGMTIGGQPETILRLVSGVDPKLPEVLHQGLGIPRSQVVQAASIIQQHLELPVVQDAMPFQDALDLGEFLVDATIKMTRFMPGAPTVGGPVEVAGITKHEGFKWVQRKHYYGARYNPPAPSKES